MEDPQVQWDKNYERTRDTIAFLGGFIFKSTDVIQDHGFSNPLYTCAVCGVKGTLYGLGCVFICNFLPGDTKWLCPLLTFYCTAVKIRKGKS